MANLELLSTSYYVRTIKVFWFLIKWHKHVNVENANEVWLEPIRGRRLAKWLYGPDKLDKDYFWERGINLMALL